MNATNHEIDSRSEVNAKNYYDLDDDVNRMRSFDGQLSRFLHQTGTETTASGTIGTSTQTRPFLQRRITRSQSSSLSPGTSSPRSLVHASPLNPATTTTSSKYYTKSPSISPCKSSRLADGKPIRSRKRKHQTDEATVGQRKKENSFSPPSRLQDTIPPNLTLLLIGVNPGLMTGSTGYAYAHPSNLFWKLLHTSGITPIRHPPSDTYKLPELYNIGNTNIVVRPTRDASMLTKAEMDAGVPILEAKIAAQRPEVVALVGKSIWESIWRVRHGGKAIKKEEFKYGWQDASENMGRCENAPPGWDGARVFVATTTSGLAATMSMQQKQEVWNELGSWVKKRREETARETTIDIDSK